jgi:hypothetical protein
MPATLVDQWTRWTLHTNTGGRHCGRAHVGGGRIQREHTCKKTAASDNNDNGDAINHSSSSTKPTKPRWTQGSVHAWGRSGHVRAVDSTLRAVDAATEAPVPGLGALADCRHAFNIHKHNGHTGQQQKVSTHSSNKTVPCTYTCNGRHNRIQRRD